MRLLLLTLIVAATVLLSFVRAEDDRATLGAKAFFRKQDANKDGKLSKDEFPRETRKQFPRIDANGDGFITLAEAITFRRKRIANAGRRGLPEGFTAHRDLKYAKGDSAKFTLDVYAPKTIGNPRPLIVWVHGGGWRNGSKDRCPVLPFLEKGYVVASINYRLSGEAIFPAQIEDCKAAIRWLRAHAKTYGIDAKRVGVWGSSAGGHLVALLGTSGDVKDLEQQHEHRDQSSRVQAVVDFFGPTDLLQMDDHALPTAPFKHNAADSPESKFIGGQITKHPERVARVNPITYVTKDDPPFLIVHGDQDRLVPTHQSRILHAALTKAGVDSTLHIVKGAGHGFGRNADVAERVVAFFKKHLKKSSNRESTP